MTYEERIAALPPCKDRRDFVGITDGGNEHTYLACWYDLKDTYRPAPVLTTVAKCKRCKHRCEEVQQATSAIAD